MRTSDRHLIDALQAKTGLTKEKSKKVWRAVEAIIIEELLAGNEFYMRGILSMQLIDVHYRKGYNITTKEMVDLDPFKKVKYKTGARLKKIIKEETANTEE